MSDLPSRSHSYRRIVFALAATTPAVVLRLSGVHLADLPSLLIFGGAVVGAACILTWAAEAAQMDVSQGLAIAVLALIAVLPEYAVDLYFAWTAGKKPEYAQYAAANMTGSNRLLIGIGWALVAFMAARWMAKNRPREHRELDLRPERSVEILFLAAASTYAFIVPIKGNLAWYDSLILIGLFGLYAWRISGASKEEPELMGVAATLGALPKSRRRRAVGLLFLASAGAIIASAEPFAEALIGTGTQLGIDRFLLVQWLAPLASESPELIVAVMLAMRGKGEAGLGTLLSSKLNQWTLLVGSLPIAYGISHGSFAPLPLDARQVEEFLLTSAQAVMAVAVLTNLRFMRWEAGALLGLFLLQLPFPQTSVRYGFSVLYIFLAIGMFV
ncbi:MAG: sodium:proton exchanger, partial [Actinomycetota bacterium]